MGVIVCARAIPRDGERRNIGTKKKLDLALMKLDVRRMREWRFQ